MCWSRLIRFAILTWRRRRARACPGRHTRTCCRMRRPTCAGGTCGCSQVAAARCTCGQRSKGEKRKREGAHELWTSPRLASPRAAAPHRWTSHAVLLLCTSRATPSRTRLYSTQGQPCSGPKYWRVLRTPTSTTNLGEGVGQAPAFGLLGAPLQHPLSDGLQATQTPTTGRACVVKHDATRLLAVCMRARAPAARFLAGVWARLRAIRAQRRAQRIDTVNDRDPLPCRATPCRVRQRTRRPNTRAARLAVRRGGTGRSAHVRAIADACFEDPAPALRQRSTCGPRLLRKQRLQLHPWPHLATTKRAR